MYRPPYERDPDVTNLGDVFDPQAPDDRAWVIDVEPDGNATTLTYGEARALIDAVARGLSRRGLSRGASVGILSANRAEVLIAYFGIMRAGFVAVPINHKLPRDVVDHIVKDSAIALMYADAERATMVPSHLPMIPLDATAAGWRDHLDPGAFTAVAMEPDEPATILYTSGSTGMPKGVPLLHGPYVWMVNRDIGLRDVLSGKAAIVAAPLFHMNALFFSKQIAQLGATNVLLRQFSGRAYIEAIDRYRVTVLTSVPTMLALAVREREALARADLSCVKFVFTGSAPLTQALADTVRATFPGAVFSNGYGTTEGGPSQFGPHPQGKPRPDTAIGYPQSYAEVKLVGGATPDEGVLHLRTPTMMPGYLNLPQKTREKLNDGWYDTGDVMRRDADGFFHFVGRADDMFVCGGENIYPGEVEKMLERHPAIHQASVVPVADEIKGEVPVAFLVARKGMSPTEADIKQHALANGPAYAHPRRVVFLPELPLAGTNKIDRKALIGRAREMFPNGVREGR
ncbi:acyl--CoA ligase [Vineibacter terrae]|uniref:Acyl--CoA ligase n=1 Tax=Vineibacter terrae TaxID=2586908 RepID=A0A5C8PGX1_9HYPH|nr:class I adenylate-forming enzyme family protein [Vineibacter terrae]TXL73074.1 acyl--CoA ligase [Vineibacter terrae]